MSELLSDDMLERLRRYLLAEVDRLHSRSMMEWQPIKDALHEIVTNGEHTEDGGWKVSAEVYQLAYDADVFGNSEQR